MGQRRDDFTITKTPGDGKVEFLRRQAAEGVLGESKIMLEEIRQEAESLLKNVTELGGHL